MRSLFRCVAIVIAILPWAALAQPKAFDVIQSAYAPYMAADDPLAFPMKVHALSGGAYKFWRGSKDLFFQWCKANASDWIEGKDNWIVSHGDIHFGNIGSYPIAPFGQLGLGLVDFDDSGQSPIQIELMQGVITLELTARQQQIVLTEAQRAEVHQQLFESFKQSLRDPKATMHSIANEKRLQELLNGAGKDYLKGELNKLVSHGKFVQAIVWKDGPLKGQPKELFLPAMDRADDFAAAIEQAIAGQPPLAERFGVRSRSAIRASIKDVTRRTRLGSSGSQGLKKYVILMEKPLAGIDHDVVIYLKQEIPAAAERTGLMSQDPRSPAERLIAHNLAMVDVPPFLSGYLSTGSESYWITIKEPWSQELDAEEFHDFDDLKLAARIWGTIAGASHLREARASTLADRLNAQELDRIQARSKAYLLQFETDFDRFLNDPRFIRFDNIASSFIRQKSSH